MAQQFRYLIRCKIMKKLSLIILFLCFFVVACTNAQAADSGELIVDNVQANLALPSETGSVWLTIHNQTAEIETLTGAAVPGCGIVELHDMMMEDDVMVMREVEGGTIPIPAGEMVSLEKGGLHVMCMQKEAPLEVDSEVEITLYFEVAGERTVTGRVVEPAGGSMGHDDHSDHEGHMNHGGNG